MPFFLFSPIPLFTISFFLYCFCNTSPVFGSLVSVSVSVSVCGRLVTNGRQKRKTEKIETRQFRNQGKRGVIDSESASSSSSSFFFFCYRSEEGRHCHIQELRFFFSILSLSYFLFSPPSSFYPSSSSSSSQKPCMMWTSVLLLHLPEAANMCHTSPSSSSSILVSNNLINIPTVPDYPAITIAIAGRRSHVQETQLWSLPPPHLALLRWRTLCTMIITSSSSPLEEASASSRRLNHAST